MVRFLVVRHGQSLGNAGGVFVGQNDVDLSPLGHIQADITGKYLEDKKIDVIYSSDLKRAYHTAEHIAAHCKAHLISSKNLREINAGLWQGKTFDYLEKNFQNYRTWLNDIGNARCDGGETVKQLQNRISEEFKRIADKNDGQTVCIVTHAAPIRVMECIWRGFSIEKASSISWVSNCSVTSVVYDENERKAEYIGFDEHLIDCKSGFPSNV